MGEVFKAYHPETGRVAAVKVLYRPEFKARFQNEADVQASLSHPNIASLYAYTLLDERPVLVMEWIDGLALDELIRRKGRLVNDVASRLIQQIASAVAYLHQAGIIHRDLKPSNVRIRPDGQVKLLDFGIAKGRNTPILTQVGYVVGTTEFMAPEQFRSRVVAKSDIWALGVMLYEMTTGHLPFDSGNPLLLRQQIERGQFTSPQVLNAGISAELVGLMAQCLQPNPAHRPTAAELVHQLSYPRPVQPSLPRFFELSGSGVLAQGWPTLRKYGPWLALLLVGVLGSLLVRTSPVPPAKRISGQQQLTPAYEQLKVEVLNADYDIELITPDGAVQTKEPFLVKRLPGQPLPITIRHQGVEQQFVIDPDIQELYQCYFDR